MDRRDLLAASSSALALTAGGAEARTTAGAACSAPAGALAGTVHEGAVVPDGPIGLTGPRAAVYTTAAGTANRLAATGTVEFKRL